MLSPVTPAHCVPAAIRVSPNLIYALVTGNRPVSGLNNAIQLVEAARARLIKQKIAGNVE